MNTAVWDQFFGNPILKLYLEEAEQPQPTQEVEPSEDIQKLGQDLKQGNLSQDDIISMYKSGKLQKEDVQTIVDIAQGTEAGTEAPAPDGEPELSEEELFAQQIDQTNDLFIKFALYDKVTDLTDKLDYFKDNFEDIQSEAYEKVVQLSEFLNVLSNLIFTLETTVSYQMYGSILLQLTEIFTEHNAQSNNREQVKKINSVKNEKYRSGEESPDDVDQWAEDNESHLIEQK